MTLLAGTIGEGLWSSNDGQRWAPVAEVPATERLFALAGDEILYAGAAGAVYRRRHRVWRRCPLAEPDLEVWALAVHPTEPLTVFAGTRPLGLFRSDDAGERWRRLTLDLPEGTERPHTPRVTALVVDTTALWCGVEVGGVFVSDDGGLGFHPVNDGLPSLDIHGLAWGRDVVAATARGLARYDGRWTTARLEAPWTYCRAVAGVPGTRDELLCGLGDGPPGTRGAVVVSPDGGRSWHSALFPGTAASTVWSIAVDGDLALAAAFGGELFTSDDAGRSWRRLERRFREVRAVHLTSD